MKMICTVPSWKKEAFAREKKEYNKRHKRYKNIIKNKGNNFFDNEDDLHCPKLEKRGIEDLCKKKEQPHG